MRKNPLEIIEKILGILEKSDCPMSMNAIARETGIHNITVKRYVEIIEKVNGDNIEIIRTNRSIILRCSGKNKI